MLLHLHYICKLHRHLHINTHMHMPLHLYILFQIQGVAQGHNLLKGHCGWSEIWYRYFVNKKCPDISWLRSQTTCWFKVQNIPTSERYPELHLERNIYGCLLISFNQQLNWAVKCKKKKMFPFSAGMVVKAFHWALLRFACKTLGLFGYLWLQPCGLIICAGCLKNMEPHSMMIWVHRILQLVEPVEMPWWVGWISFDHREWVQSWVTILTVVIKKQTRRSRGCSTKPSESWWPGVSL